MGFFSGIFGGGGNSSSTSKSDVKVNVDATSQNEFKVDNSATFEMNEGLEAIANANLTISANTNAISKELAQQTAEKIQLEKDIAEAEAQAQKEAQEQQLKLSEENKNYMILFGVLSLSLALYKIEKGK